jgi:hypothetical protein
MEKSISQYQFNFYKYDKTEEFGWKQVIYWEYMLLDYADSDLLAATLSFAARSRSHDISKGFTTTETQNGEMGYWDLKSDHNSDDTFYYVTHVRSDQSDPYTGNYDHIKIFLHNVHQGGKGVRPLKIAQCLYLKLLEL